MTKTLIYTFIILTSTFYVKAQETSTEKELQSLENIDQAKNYLEKKSSRKNKLLVFNEEKHKTTLAKKIFKLPVGGTEIKEREFEKTYYKVVEKSKTPCYRVSYIYIDGNKFDLKKINSYREEIIDKYNNSTPFDFLAKRHSMDRNASRGGDSGWFSASDNNTTFESLIIDDNHDLNSIFVLDIPSESAYYVVLKTHESKEISETKVLKIVESRG